METGRHRWDDTIGTSGTTRVGLALRQH